MKFRPPPQAGFTLMEMLIVIAVMGLVLLLVAGYGPPRSHRLEVQAAAQNIADALRSARGQAIAHGTPVTLHLPPVPGWLTASIQAPAGKITFAPDGSSSGGRVQLDGDGFETTISTDWLTGQVQIHAQ